MGVRLHVRICMRKGIHANRGSGLAMVQAMHAAMWGGALHYDQETSDNSAGQRVNYDRRSQVLVVFLSAIEGAEKAHSKHGYTYLGDEKDDGPGSCTSKMAHGHCPRMKCCTCTRSTVEEH